MPWIFGYGSLISPQSAAKTLGRSLSDKEYYPGEMQGFVRKWQLVAAVILTETEEEANAVFLDIERNEGKSINGLLLKVTEEDLGGFDLREGNYQRIDVTDQVSGLPAEESGIIYTYFGMPEHTQIPDDAFILEMYHDRVEKAVEAQGKEFEVKYAESTLPSNLPLRPGSYTFSGGRPNTLSDTET